MAFKCDQCGKDFNTEQGMSQHKLDKHGISSHEKREQKKQDIHEQQKSASSSARRKKTMRNVAIVAIILVAIAGIGWAVMNFSPAPPSSRDVDILNTNLYSHSGVAMHIHPRLTIEINGQAQAIPGNIGISGSVMRVIHTHDATGTLHVESPVPHDFVLKDFFTIWRRNFNSTCIFEFCANETHELTMTVNGQPSDAFGDLPLRDLDNIRIVYSEKS